MCENKSTRFFRPWNAPESTDDTAGSGLSCHEEQGCSTALVKQEEDMGSISSVLTYEETSATSSSENEVSSRCTKRRKLRRTSESSAEGSSRSCSVNSDDRSGSNNSDLLNNVALESPHGRNFSVSSLVHDGSPFSMVNSSITNNSSHPVNCLQNMGLMNCFDSFGGCVTFEPTVLQGLTISTTGQPFYRDLPPVHLSQGLYTPSVEQAVEMIHRQDAAAKQMKKLRPKKFRCEHCDVAFSNNGQLKGHIRIHTGERPFKCDAEGCGKSFTRNEELTRHKRIHTGIRPHACLVCGKRFGRKDHLKKHTRTHENRDPYRMSAAALGMFAMGHTLPQGYPFQPYVCPI